MQHYKEMTTLPNHDVGTNNFPRLRKKCMLHSPFHSWFTYVALAFPFVAYVYCTRLPFVAYVCCTCLSFRGLRMLHSPFLLWATYVALAFPSVGYVKHITFPVFYLPLRLSDLNQAVDIHEEGNGRTPEQQSPLLSFLVIMRFASFAQVFRRYCKDVLWRLYIVDFHFFFLTCAI